MCFLDCGGRVQFDSVSHVLVDYDILLLLIAMNDFFYG